MLHRQREFPGQRELVSKYVCLCVCFILQCVCVCVCVLVSGVCAPKQGNTGE